MSARTMSLAVGALAALAACNSEPISPPDDTALAPSFITSATGATVVTDADVSRQAEETPPLKSWVLYIRPDATGTFRVGPGSPPEGVGSLEFFTPGLSKITLFNFDYDQTPIADFTALAYHTYQSSASVAIQLPSINLTVDFNGPSVEGGFTTLVFEPVYNLVGQGAVLPNVWQDWDGIFAGNAIWWSTRSFGTVCAVACYVTWNQILEQAPNATILLALGLNQGSGSPALTASTDAFVVGVNGHSTTYDFEPFVTASNKGDCKDGGWQNARRSDGSPFKNQGDCVSYTNRGR